MDSIEEIRHFLEKEIEISERRLEADPQNLFYDGVDVGRLKSKKLIKNHISFCKRIIQMIDKVGN